MNFPVYIENNTITVKDIYGIDQPEAPIGYEFTGEFRKVRPGEIFGGAPNLKCILYPNNIDYDALRGPRLILRPLKKLKRLTFTATEAKVRKLEFGERGFGLRKDGTWVSATGNNLDNKDYYPAVVKMEEF